MKQKKLVQQALNWIPTNSQFMKTAVLTLSSLRNCYPPVVTAIPYKNGSVLLSTVLAGTEPYFRIVSIH